jgi:predicted nucleic acid-binding protein
MFYTESAKLLELRLVESTWVVSELSRAEATFTELIDAWHRLAVSEGQVVEIVSGERSGVTGLGRLKGWLKRKGLQAKDARHVAVAVSHACTHLVSADWDLVNPRAKATGVKRRDAAFCATVRSDHCLLLLLPPEALAALST